MNFFDTEFLAPLFLSLKLASITTIILFPIGILLGYLLAFWNKWWIKILETLIWLPLILPPSVLGFYLLLTFSPNYAFGSFLENTLGIKLAFSFWGIVIGSIIFSLPFMVNPIKSALISLPKNLKEASYTLGKTPLQTLFLVLLPNIIPSLLLACITTFAHTIGEFGVVLMLGGDIEGVSRTASIAIYTQTELLNYTQANYYALILTITSFCLLFAVILLSSKFGKRSIL